jgi:hypothetical protein
MKKWVYILLFPLVLFASQALAGSVVLKQLATGKWSQTISLTDPSDMTVGEADQTITCTTTSGNSCSLSTNNASYCTIVSGKLHAVGASGINGCIVYADQSGNSGWYAGAQVNQTVTITDASCTPPSGTRFTEGFEGGSTACPADPYPETCNKTWSTDAGVATIIDTPGSPAANTACSKSIQFAAASGATVWIDNNGFVGNPLAYATTTLDVVFYVYFSTLTLPNAFDSAWIWKLQAADESVAMWCGVMNNNPALRFFCEGDGRGSIPDVTVTTNTWYKFKFEYKGSALSSSYIQIDDGSPVNFTPYAKSAGLYWGGLGVLSQTGAGDSVTMAVGCYNESY